MSKKILSMVVLSTIMASGSALASSSGSGSVSGGQVKFLGEVVSAACGIDPSSIDQTIDFGQLSSAHLNGGGKSVVKDVDIKLVNCVLAPTSGTPPVPNNTVAVTFGGTTVDTAKLELGTAGGTDTSILMSAEGNPVEFGKENTPYNFLPGDNTLHFKAWVQKSSVAKGDVNEGAFSAVTNFVLTYA
ncbi:fimbrial protein [Photobacterium damselae]|uniref:fimbrial protein n=1 Tax=Photobacterium damselae TaxID=38293 RepID=UPI0039076BFD